MPVCYVVMYSHPWSVCDVALVSYVGAVTVMRVLLFVLHVIMVIDCEGARVTEMQLWETGEVWFW